MNQPFEYVSDYTIVNLCPTPSMNQEIVAFKGTFAEAVEKARVRFVEITDKAEYTVKCVRVCGPRGVTTWFKIELLLGGVHETNLNTNAVYRKIEGAE